MYRPLGQDAEHIGEAHVISPAVATDAANPLANPDLTDAAYPHN